jgi:hypothetical protein
VVLTILKLHKLVNASFIYNSVLFGTNSSGKAVHLVRIQSFVELRLGSKTLALKHCSLQVNT